ncbi:MAG: SDR family oxidoreductase [Magnetococcales bacterium]|nr:SDR family oxidoreductase [Magnetococcales bacterium]
MSHPFSTALITGAGHRIGAACALALARQGIAVVIHYGSAREAARTLQQTIRTGGGEAHLLQGDLADAGETGRLLPQAEALLGGRVVEILVNNAAIFLPGTVRDGPLEVWNRHLDINLTAPFLLMQSFARRLPPEGRGKIIQIIDQKGHRPRPGYAAYSAAKSALWTLTRLAALELAPAIQVNAIGPGPILPAPGASQAAFEGVAAATPAGRSGTPEEIGAALLFLLRHDFITGEMIRVDGGEHLL